MKTEDFQMNRRFTKLTALLLALCLGLAALLGCAPKSETATATTTQAAETAQAADATAATATTATATGDTAASTATAAVPDYTWEQIVALNEGETMLDVFDEDGYLQFLGNRYCDMTITNSDEALTSLGYVKTLLGLDDVVLSYYKTDVSPVTGNRYYTFYQVGNGTINGKQVKARFYRSLVKVITDKDGNCLGLSARLTHDASLATVTADFVPQEQAENGVKQVVGEARQVYTEATEFVYWDDRGTVKAVSDGKVVPVYLIYTDADPAATNNTSAKPYEVYVVSAEYQDDKQYPMKLMETYYADALSSEAYLEVYTSTFFFDKLDDVGNYTYTVDLSWVKEAYPDYAGEMTAEYTVPVMRDRETGLYYLGSKERLITCTNAYDFEYYSTLNAYVTENPEDLASWHFYQKTQEKEGITYFNDPNYVIASFAVFASALEAFEKRYDLPSVDGTDIPLLLEVYGTNDGNYPTEVTGFTNNAYNNGQSHDWALMMTSPTYPECLNYACMMHEYTHGINSQLTSTMYLNAAGAIQESYADIIGIQLAAVSGYDTREDFWQYGGTYCQQTRSLSNPLAFDQPKYLGGIYYVSPVDAAVSDRLDHGGVHQNSGIMNYLAYCLVEGCADVADNHVLSVEDNLDLWFESLYLTTYLSDYQDVAGFLQFAAKCMHMSPERQAYLNSLLVAMGLIKDADGNQSLRLTEDYETVTFHVNMETDDFKDLFVLGFNLRDAETNRYRLDAGDLYTEDNTLVFKVQKGDACVPTLNIGNHQTDGYLASLPFTSTVSDHYNITMYAHVCEAGDIYTLPHNADTRYFSNFNDTLADCIELQEDGQVYLTLPAPGLYFVAATDIGSSDTQLFCYVVE